VIYVAYTIHVIVCLFLILVVLLQQGKGADLSVFGGGATQSAFGARGAATLLHKLTVAGFIAFILTTISIGLMQTGGSTGSVMSTVVEEAAPDAATDEADAPPAAGSEAEQAPAETGDNATGESPADGDVVENESTPPSPDQ
jgi:preprotein translocase subunit SecG